MNDLTTAQSAYLAGIVDGEGCIGISRKLDTTGIRGGICYRPLISITNTDRRLLDWISLTTGIGYIATRTYHAQHKQAYRWDVWSQKARVFLIAVRPFLVIKADQADLILDFTAKMTRHPGRAGLSDAEWDYQRAVYEQLKALNKRGA